MLKIIIILIKGGWSFDLESGIKKKCVLSGVNNKAGVLGSAIAPPFYFWMTAAAPRSSFLFALQIASFLNLKKP